MNEQQAIPTIRFIANRSNLFTKLNADQKKFFNINKIFIDELPFEQVPTTRLVTSCNKANITGIQVYYFSVKLLKIYSVGLLAFPL